jgi:hypothetical protein
MSLSFSLYESRQKASSRHKSHNIRLFSLALPVKYIYPACLRPPSTDRPICLRKPASHGATRNTAQCHNLTRTAPSCKRSAADAEANSHACAWMDQAPAHARARGFAAFLPEAGALRTSKSSPSIVRKIRAKRLQMFRTILTFRSVVCSRF